MQEVRGKYEDRDRHYDVFQLLEKEHKNNVSICFELWYKFNEIIGKSIPISEISLSSLSQMMVFALKEVQIYLD